MGCAAECFHTQDPFAVSQVQVHVPALPIRLLQLGLGHFARRKKRSDQHLLVDFHLAHLAFMRIAAVFLHTHPGRPGGLGPTHPVIPGAELLASTKISSSRTVLFKHHIHTAPEHVSNQEIAAIVAIRQHHITRGKAHPEPSEQTVFPRAFTLVRPHDGI